MCLCLYDFIRQLREVLFFGLKFKVITRRYFPLGQGLSEFNRENMGIMIGS